MRSLVAALAGVIALSSPGLASPSAAGPVSVTISRSTADLQVGQRLHFTTLVHNDGAQPLAGLVAHLNVVSLRSDVYVDPEDWSAHRTQYLTVLPPHGAATLQWVVQAVNEGDLELYVAVITKRGSDQVVSSDALRVLATAQRGINAVDALPVALGVPAALALLILARAARRRRLH